MPDGCRVTFAQVLSRHGARDPTASKTASYNQTVLKIKARVKAFTGKYAFLANYTYNLGADQLTTFGQQEMINSGIKYYGRYHDLAERFDPFVRASGEARVVESAQNFTQGFHQAKLADRRSIGNDGFPYPIVVVSEAAGSNNTLSHDLCTDFETGLPYDAIASNAQAVWLSVFIPPIAARLNTDLPGANLTQNDVISVMDLCPFVTVAAADGAISPFCALFAVDEWHQYDYYESLGKYYGYSYGNPLGPTQGVGFTNELMARLTNASVNDHTSTNRTLDSNVATFPLGRKLYADFSHDSKSTSFVPSWGTLLDVDVMRWMLIHCIDDMTAIFSALGLYNTTSPLSNSTLETTAQTHGYSAAWTVPFAARAYFEKLKCAGVQEEYVRVLINDRVLPLQTCGGDKLGRCTLSAFVNSLSFARAGGDWARCFV